MQLAAIIVSLVLTVVGVALIARAIAQIYRFVRLGQPVPAGSRTDDPVAAHASPWSRSSSATPG